MREITLVTGGCRSGKSRFAQVLAEEQAGHRLFVATSPSLDGETAARIERHRRDRAGRNWQTIETQTELTGTLTAFEEVPVILVDCLTLWVNNLLYHRGEVLDEDQIAALGTQFLETAGRQRGHLFLVTNETGFGIVPENPSARRYRDLIGRLNQVVAARAHRVVLMVSGLPLYLKPSSP